MTSIFTRVPLCLLALLVPAMVIPAAPASAQSLRPENELRDRAIVGARIVVAPGRVIDKGNIVIRDGLIVAVGKEAQPPVGADVVDAEGLTVYAGFIDAGNSDLVDAEKKPKPAPGRKVDFARRALAATRRDNRRGLTPEFRAVTGLKLDAAAIERIRKNGFTSVHVLPSGRIAAGRGALISASDRTLQHLILNDDTFAEFQLFAMRGRTYPATLMGATAHLRQAFLDAKRYELHRELYFKKNAAVPRPAVDRTLTALNEVLHRNAPAVFLAESRDDIHRALDFARSHKFPVTIWGARDAHRCLERLSAEKVRVLAQLDFGSEPALKTPKSKTDLDPDRPDPLRAQRDRRDRWAERVAGLAELHRRGIPFAISSRNLKNRGEVLERMRLAIEHGLPRDAALAALTTSAAELLGMQNRLGTIEPGKLAHLVVTTGPFDDKKCRVRYVLIENRKFEYNPQAKPLPVPPARPAVARVPKSARRTGEAVAGEQPTELKSDRLRLPFRTRGNVLITNATVLTGTGKTLKNASVLVKDGKFAAIGTNIQPPAGVRVVDAAGRYVVPGIIDTHSHIMITGGVNEATQSIVPEVGTRDVINTDDDSEYRALAGGTTAARLFHGSANVIGGQDVVVKLKYGKTAAEHVVPDAPQGVKFALGENVKYRTTRFPNTRLGVEATLNRAFLEAIDYRRRWREYRMKVAELKGKPNLLLPPRRDLRLEALMDIVNHEKFIHSHCYRADEILMLLRVASNLGIRVWSLQHVLEGYKIAPEIVAHGASCSTFSDWWAYKVEAFDATPYNAALLNEAGANIVIKSDDRELIRHLYLEAAKTVRYGNMDPDDALQTITLNPARELGLDKRMGSIEVGKDADFAIFNGHPLNGFSRCELTFIEGELYFSRKHAASAMLPDAERRSAKAPELKLADPAVRSRKLDLAPAENGRYAIINAYLHLVDGPDIPRGTVLVDNGRIAAVGKSIDVPAGTKIIDGKGLHVSPGFIDAGTTLGLVEIGKVRETHDYAEGGRIQPDLRAGVALNRDSELIPVARAGGITTALVTPSGGVIAGQCSLARLAGWTSPEMIVNLEAGLRINWPSGSKAKEEKQQLAAFLKLARRYDKVQTHAAKNGKRPPIGDPQLEAMRPYLNRKKPVLIVANDRKEIVEALQFAEKEKLRIIITGGADAWKVAKALKKRNVPVIVGPVMRRPTEEFDPFDATYANPGRLFAAGVKFCIQSGSASNSRNAPFEAAMAAAYGLPVDQALRSVTLSAAEVLGVADRYGSLTKGKVANIVVTDGHPLQHTTQVKGVFVGGKPFAPVSRQTRFYEKYRRRLHEYQGRNGETKSGAGAKE